MRSVNKVILIGNLTRDPELKSTTSGQSIVTFGLATNRQWTTSSREKRSSAEFHECVAWAKLAEICRERLHKGMLVYVEGYLKTRSWDMEDGTRRFRTEIVLQDMIILEKRQGDSDEYVPEGGMGGEPDGSSMGDMGGMMDGGMASNDGPAPEGDSGLSAAIDDDNMF
jgi:single-strand DNA-binding protein